MGVACRKVFVDCEKIHRLPYGEEVYPGFTKYGVRFTYVYPSPKCVLVPTTIINFSEAVEIELGEAGSNIILTAVKKKKTKENKKIVRRKYVYPKKIYMEFRKLYVDPILRGEPPFSSGVVFAGAPGVGKSTLATLTAKMLGLPVYTIDPTITSKWIGESESRMKDLIDDAVSNAPSMVIIDDAEWLLRPRSLAGSEEMHEVYLNMQNILFQKLQEITDEEIPTLFIATTNIKLSELDEAFKRYGRFGETILFPLPDYEAIYTVVRDMVGDERTAVRIARMSVNSGLSMADAIGLAKKIQYGLEPVVKEKAGRGYKRIYVERVEGFEKIFKYFPREALSKRSRILMPMKEDIGTAIATQIFYSADKTVIKIVDPRHIMEAVHMANLTGSGILVSSLLDPTVLDYIHKNAEVPVVYLGEAYPKHLPVYTFYNLDTLRRIVGWKPIVESVMYMYDVSIPNDLWGKIERTANSSEGLERILETMISLGVLNEKILNYIRTK